MGISVNCIYSLNTSLRDKRFSASYSPPTVGSIPAISMHITKSLKLPRLAPRPRGNSGFDALSQRAPKFLQWSGLQARCALYWLLSVGTLVVGIYQVVGIYSLAGATGRLNNTKNLRYLTGMIHDHTISRSEQIFIT